MSFEAKRSSDPIEQAPRRDRASTVRFTGDPANLSPSSRLEALADVSTTARARVDQLLTLAEDGLRRMHDGGVFGHTLRAVKTDSGWTERLEGDSLRYASMVALGLSHVDDEVQRMVLGGRTAAELARTCAVRAEASPDAGAVALAAWSAAEAGGICADQLFAVLAARIESPRPIDTVDCAWALTAALAAGHLGSTERLVELAGMRLRAAQSRDGLFPHRMPARASGRLRAHIGCFADQVYPIQALSRLSVARNDASALAAAESCAARICALQGPAGQWWWHYDTRDGSVVERYPVYSVHQHAMAPMALLDLQEAGGPDHWRSIILGLQWLDAPPETAETLVCPQKGVIWRKVARREPAKAARAVAAVTTAMAPGLHLPMIDTLFPPGPVDHECRPYELGWLLYAWRSRLVGAHDDGSKPGEI